MRIGFDAFPAIHSYGGVGNYSRWLLKGLVSLPVKGEIIAYIPNRSIKQIDLPLCHGNMQVKFRETSVVLKSWYGGGKDLDLFHGTIQQCNVSVYSLTNHSAPPSLGGVKSMSWLLT